jgi:phage FluMu protein Com
MSEKIIWSKKPLYFSIKCDKCSSIVEFSPPAVIPQQVKVGCYKCQAINTVEKEQLSHFEDAESLFTSSSPTNGTRSGGKRSRGTSKFN